MNFTLLKMMFKKNWILLVAFTAFVLFELLVCIFMFKEIADMGILGIGGIEIQSFTTSLLPSIAVILPMVFYLFLIYRLAFKPIDSTSLSSELSAGIKRTTYLATGAIFITAMLFVMFFAIFLICGLSMLYWGSINWATWLCAIFGIFMANLVVASISFLIASCIRTNTAKFAMLGVPAIFLIFTMLASYVEGFRWLSVFMWLDIVTLELWWLWCMLYLTITATCFITAYHLFKHRRLSI